MPSTISTSVSIALASSTVMTPSLPTFCIALAIMLPILLSPFDETVPTWATSAEEETFLARFSMSLTTALTAMSMSNSWWCLCASTDSSSCYARMLKRKPAQTLQFQRNFLHSNSRAITEPPCPIPSPDARRTAKLAPWDAHSRGGWM